MIQFADCPEPGCLAAAEIVDRWLWPSTHGLVEHVKTTCLHGRWRTLVAAALVVQDAPDRVVHRSAHRD